MPVNTPSSANRSMNPWASRTPSAPWQARRTSASVPVVSPHAQPWCGSARVVDQDVQVLVFVAYPGGRRLDAVVVSRIDVDEGRTEVACRFGTTLRGPVGTGPRLGRAELGGAGPAGAVVTDGGGQVQVEIRHVLAW